MKLAALTLSVCFAVSMGSWTLRGRENSDSTIRMFEDEEDDTRGIGQSAEHHQLPTLHVLQNILNSVGYGTGDAAFVRAVGVAHSVAIIIDEADSYPDKALYVAMVQDWLLERAEGISDKYNSVIGAELDMLKDVIRNSTRLRYILSAMMKVLP